MSHIKRKQLSVLIKNLITNLLLHEKLKLNKEKIYMKYQKDTVIDPSKFLTKFCNGNIIQVDRGLCR